MRVAVLKETRAGERRVALVPMGVKALVKAGLDVTVQAGAGETSSISDDEYREAGAQVAVTAADVLQGAGMILAVKGTGQPREEEPSSQIVTLGLMAWSPVGPWLFK